AGVVSGNVAVALPGVGLTGTLALAINTGTADVDIDSDTVHPGVHVQGSTISLTLGDIAISNLTLAFDQVTDVNGVRSVTVGLAGGAFDLAGVVHMTNVHGALLILPTGVEGTLSADL